MQTMSEKYSLNWQTFSEHLQLVFKDLCQEGRYSDVTLVSDDQTQFKAHKFVLSACSPVLNVQKERHYRKRYIIRTAKWLIVAFHFMKLLLLEWCWIYCLNVHLFYY